jgi:hypothetical protein
MRDAYGVPDPPLDPPEEVIDRDEIRAEAEREILAIVQWYQEMTDHQINSLFIKHEQLPGGIFYPTEISIT